MTKTSNQKEWKDDEASAYPDMVVEYLKKRGAVSPQTAISIHEVKRWIIGKGWYKNENSMRRFWKRLTKKHIVVVNDSIKKWCVYNPQGNKEKASEKYDGIKHSEAVIEYLIRRNATSPERALEVHDVKDWIIGKGWYKNENGMKWFWKKMKERYLVVRKSKGEKWTWLVYYKPKGEIKQEDIEASEEEQIGFFGIENDSDLRVDIDAINRENVKQYYDRYKKERHLLMRTAAVAQHVKNEGATSLENAIEINKVKKWIIGKGWYKNENSMRVFWKSLIDNGTLVITRIRKKWKVYSPHNDFVYLDDYYPEGSHYLIETLKYNQYL